MSPIFFGVVSLSFALTELVRAQQRSSDGIWRETEAAAITDQKEREIVPQAYRTVRLNKDALQHTLRQAPMEFTDAARDTEVVMTLPMPDGEFARFRIEASPVMAPELAAKFPEIKTYRGQGIDDRTATIRFDVTPMGFHAMVLSTKGNSLHRPLRQGRHDKLHLFLQARRAA